MVISNENHLLRNQHMKCSVQREEFLRNSSYKQRQCNCSFSGLDSAFKPNVLSLSDIDDEETYLNFPWCTNDLEERCNVNEYMVKMNMNENKYLLPQNQHNIKKEFSYALPEVKEVLSENEPIDELNNFDPKPRFLDFNKENKAIIVNSAFIKNKTNDGTSSRKEEPSPNFLTNQQTNLEKSHPLNESNDINSTSSEPRKRRKPVEMQANIEKDIFNAMNKEQKMFNDNRFPHHLHSSYITKEYRTTSFFDDFLNSNPSFGSYKDSSAEHRKYGCSSDCLRTKIADILKSPIENELNSQMPTRAFELDPHVCYMEPKCSMSCQGIPNKTPKCGPYRYRPELKRVPIYNPQYNYTNSCCTSNWDFRNDPGLIDFDERCCRRKPVRTNRIQDATLYQKLPEACYLNDSDSQYRYRIGPHYKNTSIEKIDKSEIENDHQEYRYQKGPHYKKTSVEKINNSEIENDHQEQSTKKKKHFSCCKSGKVDEHEISSDPKSTSDQTNFQLNESKNKTLDNRCVGQKQYPPIQNINYDHFDCDFDCPMVMQPEKEHHLIYMPPRRTTKSIGCDCDQAVAFPRTEDNTKDLGRNITIQIMPNCCQRGCSEHHNTCTVDSPNKRPKNYCQEIPDERKQIDYFANSGYQEITYPLYETQRSIPVEPRKIRQYRKYDSKNNCNKWWGCNWRRKKPQTPAYQRNCVYTSDCCTTTCEDSEEVIAGDCRMIKLSNCQRVLPIKNDYISRDRNLLKSLHRLNRGLLKDLFATPCPSTSSACSKPCHQKMRGAPFPMCAGTNPFCQVAKPFTTNQCCQYEPNYCQSERVKTSHSTQDILLECLKYLKRGIPKDHCEYFEEGCCCCCQNYKCCGRQSFNCCSCNNGCYHQQPRTCEFKEEIQPKSEEKESKTCCTRCRSVEAKQSTKNCATVVSNHCFTRVETVCTNTETPEIKKPRKCFRRRCCCCCNNDRNCCCCCENFSCSEPPSCRNIHRSCCNREHFVYHCQCESKPIFQFENLVANEIEEPSYKELLVTDVKNTVSEKKGNTDTKETENTDKKEIRSDLSVNPSNSLQKTSNNIYSPVKYRPQRQDVLIKSITLDLCDLGEKKISKFSVPSRSYPWMRNSFYVDLPNEMNQFIDDGKFEHFLSETIDDPTPCLKPEVIHISDSKQQVLEVEPLDTTKEINEPNIREEISDSLTCKAFIKNDETSSHSSISNIENEVKELSNNNNSDRKEANINDKLEIHENKERVSNDDDAHKEMKLEAKNKYQQKNSKTKSKVSLQISTGSSANLSKKPSNISKPSGTISYIPKPFTTRTGLMSVIPSFREIYKSPSQVKTKTAVNKNTKIPQKLNKNMNEQGRSKNGTVNARLKKRLISESTVELTGNNHIETGGITNSTNFDSQYMKFAESEKREIELKGLEANEPNEEYNKSIDIKKCGEEIHASHKRCLSKNDQLKNISNTRVANMIAVMKFKSSDSPAIDNQVEKNNI